MVYQWLQAQTILVLGNCFWSNNLVTFGKPSPKATIEISTRIKSGSNERLSKYLTVKPGCSFTRLTVVYMAGIMIGGLGLVVLETEEFRGHLTGPTFVNAMLLGFFLSDNRATMFWRARLHYWSDRLRWRWAPGRPAGTHLGDPTGAGGGGRGGGGGGDGGGTNSITVNLQPILKELCVTDLA